MIFPKKIGDTGDFDLVGCNMLVKNVLTYLQETKRYEERNVHRELSIDAVFRIMEHYRYDAWGRVFPTGVPGYPGNRLLRRFLMLAQRFVYPEYAREQEPVALHIQDILRKLYNERDWDLRILDADGPRVVRFFEILSNRLKNAIERGDARRQNL